MRVVFADVFDNISALPTGLQETLPDGPTEAQSRDYRNQQGALALMRSLRQIKLHDPSFAANAVIVRDAFAAEFPGEDINTDLLAAFADGP